MFDPCDDQRGHRQIGIGAERGVREGVHELGSNHQTSVLASGKS
jgi:hypothetical protein